MLKTHKWDLDCVHITRQNKTGFHCILICLLTFFHIVFYRAFDHVFETVSVTENCKFLIHASYLEIYNEEIRDLLGKDAKAKLDLKEHPDKGVYVSGGSGRTVPYCRLPWWHSGKASTWTVADTRIALGFASSSHFSDLKSGNLASILPGPLHYTAGFGWLGICVLWLGEIASLICSFYKCGSMCHCF